MNSDIRIGTGLLRHRKYLRLRRLAGDRALEYLISLWTAAAMQCPDGVLSGWVAADVADAAGWEGEAEAFMGWLEAECRFVDRLNGAFVLHDWAEHQPWVLGAKARREAARAAGRASGEARRQGGESDGPNARPTKGQHTVDAGLTESSRGVAEPAGPPARTLHQEPTTQPPARAPKSDKASTKRELRARARAEWEIVAGSFGAGGGRNQPPEWEDPTTAATVRRLGGFQVLCDATPKQLQELKKEFVTIWLECG